MYARHNGPGARAVLKCSESERVTRDGKPGFKDKDVGHKEVDEVPKSDDEKYAEVRFGERGGYLRMCMHISHVCK
jgi:hypothetical protein